MHYGERLHKIRELRRMTQAELAEQAGIAESAISKIEHKRRDLSFDEAVRFAEVLGVTLEELAGMQGAHHVQMQALQAMQRIRESVFELEKSLATVQVA